MAFLEPDQLKDSYTEAQRQARDWFEPYKEYERLAANEVRTDLPKNYPKVNDGSLAAYIAETPMRVLAQMFTGKAELIDRDEPWLRELAQIVWDEDIVKGANTDALFFDKIQIGLEDAITYGGRPMFAFFTRSPMYTGADFSLPDVRDVMLEPGKKSDLASDYIFMNTYFTKLQLKSLIERAQKEKKELGSTEWNIKNLQKLLDSDPEGKDAQDNSYQEDKQNDKPKSPYKVVTCFHKGVEAPFYTFAPLLGEDCSLRKRDNENPTGEIPIIYMYGKQNLKNPYGVSQVKYSGPTQNVLDYMTQADMLNTQIGSEPPIMIEGPRGDVNLNSMIYARRQFWFVGNAKVSQVPVVSDVYRELPNRMGMYKTQLQNLQGTTDATVSSESGSPGFSKTPQGVKLGESRTNAHDNALRKNVVSSCNRLFSTLLNIHFANMQGSDIRKLTDEQADRLMKAGLIDADPETNEPSVDEIVQEWDNMRAQLKFDVDANSSIAKDSEDQVAGEMEIATLLAENPTVKPALQQSGWNVNEGELYKDIIQKRGADNWEKILIQMSPEEKKQFEQQQLMSQQMAMQQQGQMGEQPQTGQGMDVAQSPELPEMPITQPMPEGQEQMMPPEQASMPEEQPPQPQEPGEPNDREEVLAVMEELSLDPAEANFYITARKEGLPEQEIKQFLLNKLDEEEATG